MRLDDVDLMIPAMVGVATLSYKPRFQWYCVLWLSMFPTEKRPCCPGACFCHHVFYIRLPKLKTHLHNVTKIVFNSHHSCGQPAASMLLVVFTTSTEMLEYIPTNPRIPMCFITVECRIWTFFHINSYWCWTTRKLIMTSPLERNTWIEQYSNMKWYEK